MTSSAVRVLVLGATGMLGHQLCREWRNKFETFATVRGADAQVLPPSLFERDRLIFGVTAEDFSSVERALDVAQPHVVVNCIGVVKQRADAADSIASISTNALFPHVTARACRARGVRFLHVSTDCVFAGTKGAYSETDAADASDLYGRTKLLGEVTAPGCLTIRTSMIGRELAGEHGLVEWFLGQVRRGQRTIPGYTSALFSGLTTRALADVLGTVIASHPDIEGLAHVAAAPISKHDLLTRLRDLLTLPVEIVPNASVVIDRTLDGSRFAEATGWAAPSWDEMLAAMCRDVDEYEQLRGVHAHR